MKEISENRSKFLLFSTILFLFISIIARIIPTNVVIIFLSTIFPIIFFILTLVYSYNNKVSWDIPIILMIIYMLIGYFCLFEYMSGIKIVTSLLTGFIANGILPLFQKEKELKNKKTFKIPSRLKKIITYSMPIVFTVILEIYYKMCTFGTPNLNVQVNSIIILLIIIYSFYFLFLSILKTTFRASLIFSIVFLILFIANQMRIFYTSDTLLLTDFLFLQTTGELANFVDVTLINSIKYIFCPTIIVIMLFIWLLEISYKYSIKVNKKSISISMFFVSLLIIISLIFPIKPLDKFILNNVYEYNKVSDYTMSVSNTRYYYKYGVISGMYGKFLETRRYEPEGYDEEGLKYTISSIKQNEGTWGQPNIIVIFSESFWDVSKLDGITFDKDITPNYHMLQQKGKTIDMITPSYGGVSANVEFEVLTGGSLNYFSKGYIPYMQLYNNSKSISNPSVISELRWNGYKTMILNASSKDMFNCDNVYDYYNVSERRHLYDEIKTDGKYVSDKYITDEIIKYFDEKKDGEKTFYFAITMGGHMPYYEARYSNYDFEVVESKYNKEITGTIKSYAQGIHMADKELGRIYDYINTLEEDTIVVFFGDHLPHLQTITGKDALFEIGYLNHNYDLESVYKQFNTQALIISNYDIEFDNTKYLSPDLLLTYVMNNMNINLTPYYRWLYTTIDTLPSSNYVVSIDKEGNLYYTLGLEGSMKDTYDLRNKVQYMLFR